MFNFKSTVHFVLVALLCLNPVIAFPQGSRPATPGAAPVYSYNPQEECRGKQGKSLTECLRNIREATTAGPSDICREAQKNFEDKSGEFRGACTAVGLTNDETTTDRAGESPDEARGRQAGAIGCSWSMNRCRCLDDKLDPDEKERYKCRDASGTRRNSPEAAQSALGLIDINAARKRLELCPHEEPDDTDRYEKQLEKSQERIRELRKKLPEVMQKNSEAQDKATQAQNEARRKAVEKQKEFANEMKEIKRKREADEQAAVQEMNQLRQQMDATDAQIRNLELAKVDAETKLGETRVAIELQCHAMASKQVSDLQARKMADIKRGQPVSDFNGLLKSVGVSSRQAWENKADEFYRRCLGSRPTRESKASAQKVYDGTLRALDSQITTERQKRRQMETNIAQIVSNGCAPQATSPGQPAGESRMCRALRQANEDATNAQQQAAQEQQQIQQEMITAQQQMATKNQQLSMEYADAQRELNDEQNRMNNLRQYLNLKRDRRKGVGGKKAGEDLNANFGKLSGAAGTFDGCCMQDDKAEAQARQDGTEFSRQTSKEKCTSAMNFLEHLGQVSAQRNQMRSPEPLRPRPRPDALRATPESVTPRGSSTPGEGVRENERPTWGE